MVHDLFCFHVRACVDGWDACARVCGSLRDCERACLCISVLRRCLEEPSGGQSLRLSTYWCDRVSTFIVIREAVMIGAVALAKHL